MTEQERKCLEAFGDAWNMFTSLPREHPADIPEMLTHLHAIQNCILARATYREENARLAPQNRRLPYFPKRIELIHG